MQTLKTKIIASFSGEIKPQAFWPHSGKKDRPPISSGRTAILEVAGKRVR